MSSHDTKMELLHHRSVRKKDGRRKRLSLQTRLALWSAFVLILVGWAGLLISEYRVTSARGRRESLARYAEEIALVG